MPVIMAATYSCTAVWTAYYWSRVNYHPMHKWESSKLSLTDQLLPWAMMKAMNSRSFEWRRAQRKLLIYTFMTLLLFFYFTLHQYREKILALSCLSVKGWTACDTKMNLRCTWDILATAQTLKTSRRSCVQLSAWQKIDWNKKFQSEFCMYYVLYGGP